MDKTSFDELYRCNQILDSIEKHGISEVAISLTTGNGLRFHSHEKPLNIKGQDSVDCYGEIALQVMKDLRDRYQAEFDAL